MSYIVNRVRVAGQKARPERRTDLTTNMITGRAWNETPLFYQR